MEDVLDVAEVTLVGRIRGRSVSGKALRMWAEKMWAGTPAASFKSNALVKGWFLVSFDCKEALEWVEGQNWAFGIRPVFFKRWTPLFDADTEKVDEFPVWVQAPSLPPFLWADSVFKSIGDLLGMYLDAERSYLHTFEKGVARILVRLNPKEGLAKTITLCYKEYEFEQKLDYELLPFRCHRYHEYGHLARDCPLGRRKRRTQKDDEEWVEFMKKAEHKAEEKIVVEEEAEEMVNRVEEEQPMDVDIQMRPSDDQPLMDSSAPVKDAVSGDEHPGMQSSSLLSAIKIDSVGGGLSKLNTCNEVMHNIENLSDALPSLNLNCEDFPPLSMGNGSSTARHYNLRSHSKKPGCSSELSEPVGGLGTETPKSISKKGRGRKSMLSKTQAKAIFDVADGKQMTIPGALRAAKPPETVLK